MDQHQFGSIDPPYPAEPIGDRNRQSSCGMANCPISISLSPRSIAARASASLA